MYGIRIDEETREFSVVDTREFGIGHGLKVAFDTVDGSSALGKGFRTLNRMDRRRRRYERINSRRTHAQKMAMIRSGMDPSTIDDYKTTALKERYGYKGHKLDAKVDRIDARSRRKAGTEQYRLDRRRTIAPERTERIRIRRNN